MSGVGNDIYNSFSAKLIRTLYRQSIEVLGRTAMLSEAAKRAKKEQSLKKNMDFLALKKSQQKKILQMPSNLLFLRYHPQRIVDISKKAFETKTYKYYISNHEYLTIEIIRSDNFNLAYLLSKLSNLDIVNMDICKLFDALKYFKIDFAQKVEEEEIGFIEEFIHDAFTHTYKAIDYVAEIHKEDIDID